MTPRRTLILALLLFLPLASLHAQDKPPSAATLIEKARILAEEKGDPKAAVKLLVDKVICRKDLSKALFDKTAKMIAIYSGGNVSVAITDFSMAPLPRQDLTRLIDKEIDAWLAGNKAAWDRILWYGKPALLPVISRLKRDWFKVNVAQLLVPLILSPMDPDAAAVFLRDLRERGPEGFRAVVAKFLRFSIHWSPQGADESWKPIQPEILMWIRTRKEGRQLLENFWPYLKPEDLMSLLAEGEPRWDPNRLAYLLSSREDIVRLKDPKPLFRVVLQEVDKAYAGKKAADFGSHLLRWLLHQDGGFDAFARAMGVYSWRFPTSFDALMGSSTSFPDAEHGLVALLSQMKNWGHHRRPYAILDDCLRNVWKDPIDKPSAELQELFLECMSTLNRMHREAEGGGTTRLEAEMQTMWGILKGNLLLKVAGAGPTFQESLWEKAIAQNALPLFSVPRRGDPSRTWRWSVESLLLDGIDGQKPWIPTTLSDDTKVQLYIRSLGQGNWSNFENMFAGLDDYSFTIGLRQKALRGLLSRKDLWKDLLSKGGTDWWAALPPNKATSFLSTVLEDSSFSEDQLEDVLFEAYTREEHPADFLAWVREKRSDLTPRPFLFIDYNDHRKGFVDATLIDALLDWIQAWIKETSSVVDNDKEGAGALDDFAAQLSPYPSERTRAFMARLLLSSRFHTRKTARGILDDWRLVEETRKKGENAELVTFLWKKTDKTHSVIVRTLALKGLFDLGDKRAWRVLSDWLESNDFELTEAAKKMAGEIRTGK